MFKDAYIKYVLLKETYNTVSYQFFNNNVCKNKLLYEQTLNKKMCIIQKISKLNKILEYI